MSSALLQSPRAALAKAVRHRVAGNNFEEAHAAIWHTPGERWFSPQDAIWRVHADTSMFIGGIRALLLQSMHPVAMLGVSEHSGFRSDPWGRLQRTSTYLATTTYGAVPDAERSIRIVRAIHRRVTGVTADGQPYRADDPHLLLWVHLAEIDSFLASYDAFGGPRLSAAEKDDYVRQTGLVVERLGVVDPPQSTRELDERMAAFRPELRGSEQATEAADLLLRNPPLPAAAKVGYAALAAGAVSLLPAWIRAELRLPTLPLTDRLIARPVARTAV
ncbi:MAG TPA: oxygenase MpaB family protein, partial [Propionibacteriaceae bacterium]|nr:oxygenase MpaB family protein [Propionibacteriaceae bacterium]